MLLSVWSLGGCATTDWNGLLYGNPKGFTPLIPVPHARQVVWSNSLSGRYGQLVSDLSQVTPLRQSPIYVMVGSYSCGLCTNGSIIYADAQFLSVLTDEEVRAALAHEMAHGDLGHIGRSQVAGELVTVLFHAVAGNKFSNTAAMAHDITKSLVVSQFSQTQEKEADRQGVAYLQALGYDGRTVFLQMLEKLQSLGLGQWSTWFSSHPSIENRIAYVREMNSPRTTGQVHWTTVLTTPIKRSDFLYRDAAFDFSTIQTYAIVDTCTPQTSAQCERERDALKYIDNAFHLSKGYRRLEEPVFADVLVTIEIADPRWGEQIVNRPIPWSTYESDARRRYGSLLDREASIQNSVSPGGIGPSVLDLAKSHREATGLGRVYDTRSQRLIWSEVNNASNMTSFVMGLFQDFPTIADKAKNMMKQRVDLERKIRDLINGGHLAQGKFDGVKAPVGYFGKYFLLVPGSENFIHEIPLEILPMTTLEETIKKSQ